MMSRSDEHGKQWREALPCMDMTDHITWFTSDLHFFHENILKYGRNVHWDTVAEMNSALINNWNSLVQTEDTVYLLGDVVMGPRQENLPIVSRLNGTIHLIAGNHDHCHSSHRRQEKWFPFYREFFASIEEEIDLTVGGHTVHLCHFPYQGDRHEQERYQDWRPRDEGRWLLHGHTHGLWKVKDRMIDVGVDSWNYHPVSDSQILEILDRS
jgi:calcineurin-like phosphoesterase family protein